MSIVKSFSFPSGETRGDTFYIQHGSNCFTVIDCYLKEGEDESCRKDEIINEIVNMSEGRICRFISTHPDDDHIRGIEALDDAWEIVNFYAVDNNIPKDDSNASLTKYIELKTEKNYAIKKGIRRQWLNEKDDQCGSSGLNFHWPIPTNEKFKKALEKVDKGESPNNICPVLTYSIQDGATYMWMGDLETDMQKEYYDTCKNNIPAVDILFQPHHGRKSGSVPPELMDKLNPKLIIIGNAPSEHIDYGDSRYTITQNTAGDIVFENDGDEVHIYTKKSVSNPPACLTKKASKRDLYGSSFQVPDWYYCGTLEV